VYGELGTLSAQCGGVFGVAGFVDKCMDKWMADRTLNANEAVTMWHQSAQRPGFKFLVVQIVCSLTGGPQVYTGRPMDEAHKHLNISESEWDKFMELFNAVCEEMSLPGEIVGDLNALMISMEEDCVVRPGERVPPNPGPKEARGNSLYAKLGGVYPIALLVDRLVDGLLADDRIAIPLDDKRNDASLKYLFTELVCSIAGGPEVRTAPGHSETMLLIPKAQWPILVNTMTSASDHLPSSLVPILVQAMQRNRDSIVDPDSSAEVAPNMDYSASVVKDMRAAAAGENLLAVANARRAAGVGASVAARRRVHGDPRTLYGRGGGVFGLAKLADRLMDVWMGEPALNANQSVAKWHQSQQKCGFKFLVTQLLGYLTGGPQRYTGQSMEAAHKHLAISGAEWDVFVTAADRVFREFNLEQSVHQELLSMIQGFQQQCTVQPGEAVSDDPGLCRRRPVGSTPYAHLGGIYPIALYADRLVDAVLRGPRQLQIRWDANGTRTPAALKYVVTEVLANATGGPEIVTAKDFEEAKLGVTVEQWDDFLNLASEAAGVWPTARHRELILRAITERKAAICVGLVDDSGVSESRRQLAESSYGVIDQAAALDNCNGDPAAALQLLNSGWTPASQMRRTNSNSSLSTDVESTRPSACPFSGKASSSASASGCPFSRICVSPAPPESSSGCPVSRPAQPRPEADADHILNTTIQVLSECGKSAAEISQMVGATAAAVDAVLSQDRYAMAARFLAKKRRVSLQQVVEVLGMSEARVHGAVYCGGSGGSHVALGGRLLGNSLQARLDELCEEDSEMCCPVTLMLYKDPVIASDGFMYEADSVKALIRNRQASPITREPLRQEYYPAKQKKSEVNAFREKRADALLKFAAGALSDEARLAGVALDRVVEYLEVLKVSQYPAIARSTADLLQQADKPVPAELRPHLGVA
jgi:hemoglobin